ncbi:serine protein kinase RIO [Pseudonocardia bannensis]|uniref:non-specific serine/threonine protein kinase n=1 Tax=Pseudonocardia bannensis TaxID=630973 RepID=A0A848DJQ7_9PSEU|nr:RIO1 family regulatory kinase/ATPase [Pseudonocardia bannensis]NMH92932.1 RIO-like kinase [Pseudonocardia bannensis]
MRSHDFDHEPIRRRRHRFDDDEPRPTRRGRPAPPELDGRAGTGDGPPDGDRWSTWDAAEHGPEPRPRWVITENAAVDTELGVLKSGKEADVHLLERAVPGAARRTLLAAKRFRTAEHRLFHRDASYLEGRRVRRSREMRAMATRTAFGRDLLAQQWARAEFAALGRLWAAGLPVPYPVQLAGTEVLLEFIGTADGAAAPRLAQLRPAPAELRGLWDQLVDALVGLARHGLTHGDLSAYNLLVHDGRLVLIDLPQVVDVIGNPQGPAFLERDVRRVADWFAARGLPPETGSADALLDGLRRELGLRTSQS